jgi:hypothetical protein
MACKFTTFVPKIDCVGKSTGYKFLGQTLKKQPIDFQRVYPVIAYNQYFGQFL